MTAYEFIVKMKDHASSGLQRVAKSAGVATHKVDGVDSGMKRANRTTGTWSRSLNTLKKVAVTAFAAFAFTSFIGKVVEARSEYERFDAVLTNTFQSKDIAGSKLDMLTDFASKTPFQLNELTGSFVKMVNRGFVPAEAHLRSLGDLASSQGKSFDQLTEAILDAETGEFERLKEFGIKASKMGNQVSLAFKGSTQTIDNNADAIRRAIIAYGQMEGVGGAMDAISKTLGGRISNLKDLWNNFLVAVGGESTDILKGGISILSTGLEALNTYLPIVSTFFKELWSYIQPVAAALFNFLKATFGFQSAGSILATFGVIMNGVLIAVDLVSSGLAFLLNALSPVALGILGLVAAWTVWNYTLAAYNALMLVNPTTWIILGIIALIGVLGMVTKYTSGWGEAWQHTVNGAKLIWKAYTSFVKTGFETLVNGLMIGLNKIMLGWYKFKDAVGMGDSSQNQSIIASLNSDVERRKQVIKDGWKEVASAGMAAKEEFGKVKINIDKDGFKKDWSSLKNKFSAIGESPKIAPEGESAGGGNSVTGKNGNGKKSAQGDSIVTGGKRTTNVVVNIQNLGTDTKIYVDSSAKGVNDLGAKIKEELLRAVNSVNQMQTA